MFVINRYHFITSHSNGGHLFPKELSVNEFILHGNKTWKCNHSLCREPLLSMLTCVYGNQQMKCTHQSLPVWALLARWSAGFGVSGLGGELSSDDSTTNLAATGKERAEERKNQWSDWRDVTGKLDKHGCKTGDEDTEERTVTTNTGNTGCSVVVQFQIKVNRTFLQIC